MAKKKTAGQGSNDVTPAGPAAAGRKRAPAARGTATASPLTGVQPTTSEETQLAVANELAPRQGPQPSFEDIAAAAYRRYLERGGTHGRDFDDWLEAERELQTRGTT